MQKIIFVIGISFTIITLIAVANKTLVKNDQIIKSTITPKIVSNKVLKITPSNVTSSKISEIIRKYPTLTPTTIPTSTPIIVQPTPTLDMSKAIPLYTPTSLPDTTPPVLSYGLGGMFTTSDGRGSKCLPLRADDDRSTGTGQFMFKHQLDSGAWTDWFDGPNAYFPCFDSLPDGSHIFSAQVKDQAGNESNILTKSFTKGSSVPSGTPVPMQGN